MITAIIQDNTTIIRETYKRIQEEASFMCVADKYLKHRDKKSTTHDKALLIQRSLDQLLFCEKLENQLKNSGENE